MSRGYARWERVQALLLEEISREVQNLKDRGNGFLTITALRLSPDLEHAKIYYSVLGTEAERTETHEALERAVPNLREKLGRLENLRKAPTLTFIYDKTPAEAARVFEIFHQLESERKTRPRRAALKRK